MDAGALADDQVDAPPGPQAQGGDPEALGPLSEIEQNTRRIASRVELAPLSIDIGEFADFEDFKEAATKLCAVEIRRR